MAILTTDYNGTRKSRLQPYDCSFSYTTQGELTASVTCDASDYYKGDVVLGDCVVMPYPYCEAMGDRFRITKISTDGDKMEIAARHITFDFAMAFCTRWATANKTLAEFVAQINEIIGIVEKVENGKSYTEEEYIKFTTSSVQNCHGLRFDCYVHDSTDARYSQKHECVISCMNGDSILSHIVTIYGCNIVRHGKRIVLTYGTESDYYRHTLSLPPATPLYKAGRNVAGYTTEESVDGCVTSIAAYTTIDISLDSNDTVQTFCGFVNRDGLSDEVAWRHMTAISYNHGLKKDDYSSYSAYKTAVQNTVKAMAQEEVNSYSWEGQNISIESAPLTRDYLFGGEMSVCADHRTQTEFDLMVMSFDYNVMTATYENVQLGRVAARLSDLRNK